jgi:tRNA (guanine-N7-)-methyltransferase
MEAACLPDLWPGLAPFPRDCWQQIFGNDRPVAVEIGPGRGEFLLASAARMPVRNFYAIERSAARARAIAAKIARSGLANARVIGADARCVIDAVPDASVATFHIQFPDPWWKRRHEKRRLWTPDFVAALTRALVMGGTIELVTDVADAFALAQRCFSAEQQLERVAIRAPAEHRTSFAQKARRRGAAIHHSVYCRRA